MKKYLHNRCNYGKICIQITEHPQYQNKIENQAKSAYAEAMGRLRKVQSELEILIARKKALKMITGDLQQGFCPR